MNALLTLDYRLFEHINSWTKLGGFFDWLAVFVARDMIVAIVALLIVYGILARDKFMTRKSLVVAFLSFVLARGLLVEIIRLYVLRNRPFISHTVVQLLTKGSEPSFPSGHMAAMVAIATAIWFYHPRVGYWLFAASFLIGLARIIVGVHYPVDIIGGILVGWLSAWAVQKWVAPHINEIVRVVSHRVDKIFF